MLDHAVLISVADQMIGVRQSGFARPVRVPSTSLGTGSDPDPHKKIEVPHSLAQNAQRLEPSHFSQNQGEVGHPKEITVEGKSWPVMRTGTRRLRTVRFEIGGKGYQAIEQNAEKPSRWGKLAREGHKVVQFRETGSGKYVAVVVDGKVTEYR